MIHADITRKEKLSPTVSTLYFHWDADVKPGQLVMVWAPGTGEIPMSLSHISPKAFLFISGCREAMPEPPPIRSVFPLKD